MAKKTTTPALSKPKRMTIVLPASLHSKFKKAVLKRNSSLQARVVELVKQDVTI